MRVDIEKIAKLSLGLVILLGSYTVIGILLGHDLSAYANAGGTGHVPDIQRLQPYVAASGFGAAILGYVLWDSQRPLWEIRDGKKPRETRNAAAISLGIFLITIGAGYGLLSFVEITRLDKSSQVILPWVCTIIIGTTLLVLSVLVARGPFLFGSDDASMASLMRLNRRRVALGAIVTCAGATLVSFIFWYGSAKYSEYVEAHNELLLTQITLVGLLIGGMMFLGGISTLIGEVPFPHVRSKLYPYDDSLERK
jgi:hypothetical protein